MRSWTTPKNMLKPKRMKLTKLLQPQERLLQQLVLPYLPRSLKLLGTMLKKVQPHGFLPQESLG